MSGRTAEAKLAFDIDVVRLYVQKELSTAQIASRLAVCQETIIAALHRCDIPLRAYAKGWP